METNNSVNMGIQENADGGQVKLGITQRFLKWLGADITITGSGSATHTFPATSSTLLSNQAGEISALTEKTTLVNDDLFIIEDSADGNNKKKVKKSNVGGGGGSSDGWNEVTDSWSYASASTITIPSNGTTIYQKWMKIRFKQGGDYKYYIASAIAPTLITVVVNTDYTVANSAITDIAYSFIEDPLGFPAFFNTGSGVMVNVTVGNGTFNSIYQIKGNLFKANVNLTWAAANPTSAITGQVGYVPPVGLGNAKLITYTTVGAGAIVDAGTALYMCECIIHRGFGRIELRVVNAAGTYAVWGATSSTVPITMGANDLFTMEIEFLLD